jgi:hypothetical protein
MVYYTYILPAKCLESTIIRRNHVANRNGFRNILIVLLIDRFVTAIHIVKEIFVEESPC